MTDNELKILEAMPGFGLELARRAAVSKGSVYFILEKLCWIGLADVKRTEYSAMGGRPRKVYAVTKKGKRCLKIERAYRKAISA